MVRRIYFGLDAETLATMKAETVAAISAAKKRGTSVSLPDATMNFSSLPELQDELAEILAAIEYAGGRVHTRTVARL